MNECMKKKLSTQTSKEEGNRPVLSKPPWRTYNTNADPAAKMRGYAGLALLDTWVSSISAIHLSLEVAFNHQTTLQLTKPYEWAIFTQIYDGKVREVVNLLRNREASPVDDDPYRLGLFYVCYSSNPQIRELKMAKRSMLLTIATKTWA